MAEHKAVIVYAGSKLYPVWKQADNDNYIFIKPQFDDDTQVMLETYTFPEKEVDENTIEKLANWLVEGIW